VGLMDDTAVFGERLTAGQARSLFTIVNDSALDYDATEMQQLFDLFDAGSGSAVVGGTAWYYADSLVGSAGDTLNLGGGNFAVVLDGSGNGVSTVPEPSAFLLLGVGLLGLVGWRRRKRP